MSNFLHHLIQRSLSPTTASVQPRLASRYEGSSVSAKFTEELRETISHSSTVPMPLLNPAPSTPPPTAEAPLSRPPSPESTSRAVPAPTYSRIEPPLPILSALAPTVVSPLIQVGPRETRSVPPPATNTLLVENITERIHEVKVPRMDGTFPPAAATNIAPSTPTHPTRATPHVSPPLSPSLAHAVHLPPAPAPAPTVQVTIGRIEIRAIHVPQAVSTRASQPARRPLVSLDHFLNQRDSK